MEITEKKWGCEKLIVNNGKYCGKFLILNKGFMCSIHFHKIKDETFHVLKGKTILELNGVGHKLETGDTVHVPIDTPHRFIGIEDCELLEISTQDIKSDSYRQTQSGEIDAQMRGLYSS